MGPIPELLGFPPISDLELFHYFFACFSILHIFTFLSLNTPQQGAQECRKSSKSSKKHPSDPAWKTYLQKAYLKSENRIPLNVLSMFPRFPGIPKNITNCTQMDSGTANCIQNWYSNKQRKTNC